MKWFILICLIIGTKLTESRNIKRDAEHQHRKIGDVHKKVGDHIFNAVTLIMLSQNLQKCSLEDLQKVVTKIHDFAKHCEEHSEEEECGKPAITTFYSAICAIPGLNTKYDWTGECCGKEEAERKKCFIEKRHVDLAEPEKPSALWTCNQFQQNPQNIFDSYIYEVGRRYDDIFPPAALGLAKDYQSILSACCGADDMDQCFIERNKQHKKVLLFLATKQGEVCNIVENYPARTLHALKYAEFARKYPKATPTIAYKIAGEIVHLHQDCCHGDVIECLAERLELTEYTCEHHEEISSKLESCCTKPLLERIKCILDQENDDAPENLPPLEEEFVNDPKVCEHLAKEKDVFLARFLHAFTIRHPELSPIQDVRVANAYQQLLVKACKEENPHEYYKIAPTLLKNGIKESKDILQKNCEAQAQLGDYQFTIELISRYVKKIPQMDVKTLVEFTSRMADVGKKCCALDEKHKMPCADELLSYIIGDLCEKQKKTFINDNLAGCCNGHYTDRRQCLINLGADPNYVPPAVDENSFHLDESLCTVSKEQLPNLKLGLYVGLFKVKPNLDSEKLPQVADAFLKLQGKCCAAPDRHECFATEKPLLIEHCRQLFEH